MLQGVMPGTRVLLGSLLSRTIAVYCRSPLHDRALRRQRLVCLGIGIFFARLLGGASGSSRNLGVPPAVNNPRLGRAEGMTRRARFGRSRAWEPCPKQSGVSVSAAWRCCSLANLCRILRMEAMAKGLDE
ncbi:hypothetical protein LY76DRAFT_382530 [Colletotrichum caudatum]|nr:hypothetical protein LY76DRAFT_382530 [Colletotrichum caudatum]